MSGEKYKILNSELNSILQFLNASDGKYIVSGKEVEFLLKSQQSWFGLWLMVLLRVWMNIYLLILEPSIMKVRN